MNNLDFEMVVILAVMSLVAAIGLVAFIAAMIGISVMKVGLLSVWGIIFGFAGVFFGILILTRFVIDGKKR